MRDKESVLQNDDELRRFFVIKNFFMRGENNNEIF